ncbi:MAG: lytic transglycosylase domain-containing protein [bacterium]
MRLRNYFVTTAAAFLLFAAFHCAAAQAQETAQNNAEAAAQAQVIYDSSHSENAPRQQQIYQELGRIEQDYTRVVKYYNKTLSDSEALQIARYILFYSNQFKIDARLLMSVIAVESRFRPQAVSHAGAMGLGQLMPGTASALGVKNAFSAQENIYGTARYLRAQYDRWASEERVLDMMLAAYNAGPEAVARYNGIPPYSETQNYVVNVKKLFRFFIYGY